uniref:Uncharacterized protein n=1 Tax=Cacopsylla melanoneura TaxID=428564 RepID=A0A8D8VSD8_9HEMI
MWIGYHIKPNKNESIIIIIILYLVVSFINYSPLPCLSIPLYPVYKFLSTVSINSPLPCLLIPIYPVYQLFPYVPTLSPSHFPLPVSLSPMFPSSSSCLLLLFVQNV